MSHGAAGRVTLRDLDPVTAESLVSHQLRLLRHLGLVRRVRDGRLSVYELHDEHVAVLLAEAVHHVDHTRLADEAAVASELR
jgi:DNA-binding transcriptional ArsR family regulator